MRFPIASAVVLAAVAAVVPGFARGDDAPAETTLFRHHCAAEIPADQAIGFVALPEGDVFCPLLADPKAARSFASYVRGSSESALGTDLASVGIADRFALARWGGPVPGEGTQVGLEGGVFAQFDMRTASADLVNADYLIGIPVTLRRGSASARLRLYHQSSHLGDEYLLRSNLTRENFSYESLEAILSWDTGLFRVYGGGENVFAARPTSLEFNVAHGGAEFRSPRARLAGLSHVSLVAAGDLKAVESLDWDIGWSGRAGIEVSSQEADRHATRPWSLMAEYYEGPSPYGQFFRSEVKYYGFGIHFAP